MKKDGFLIIKVVVTENGVDELIVIMKIRARRLMILVLCCIVDYLAILGFLHMSGIMRGRCLPKLRECSEKAGAPCRMRKIKSQVT